MKSWQKAVLLSGIVCIALVGLSMLVAYGIMATSGLSQTQSAGGSTYTYKPKAHREKPGVEPFLEQESHDKPEKPRLEPVGVDSSEDPPSPPPDENKPQRDPKSLDLDDQDVLGKLSTSGLRLTRGQTSTFEKRENASTGYTWIRDESECEGIVTFEETTISPEECCGYPDTRVYTVTAVGQGECTFRIAEARPWEFEQDMFETWDE